jgi:hypothetical protein
MNTKRMLGLGVAAVVVGAVTGLGGNAAFANPAATDTTDSTGFGVAIDVAGTGVVIDYTLDSNGEVAGASTSSGAASGASVSEVNLTMNATSGVAVQFGDDSTDVEDVPSVNPTSESNSQGGTDVQDSTDGQDGQDSQDSQDGQASDSPDAGAAGPNSNVTSGDHGSAKSEGADQGSSPAASQASESEAAPAESHSPESSAPEHTASPQASADSTDSND